jgi:hypothetical protein
MSLTESTQAFLDGPAEASALSLLADSSRDELLALVHALETGQKRNHLEFLGQSGLEKVVRKTARKAAHKLKSMGVSGESVRPTATIDLSTTVTLDEIALISAPGFRGQGWWALCNLPGASAIEIICKEGPSLDQVHPLETLSVGRLKSALRAAQNEATSALPIIANGHLAVRVIDRMEADLKEVGAEFPSHWTQVLNWREAAIRLGADPNQASATTKLADKLAQSNLEPATAGNHMMDTPESGVLMPPTAVLRNIFDEVNAMVHSNGAHTRESFDAHLYAMADLAIDAWLADDSVREGVAMRLETSADVLCAIGEEEGAIDALWVSQALRDGRCLPHEIGLFSTCFRTLIAVDRAWSHFDNHAKGEDCGHDHGDTHVHGPDCDHEDPKDHDTHVHGPDCNHD